MQSVSSRIWTRVSVSIFYDDNHYTMGTSRAIAYVQLILSVCNNLQAFLWLLVIILLSAQSVRLVEYTDCISAEE